MTSSVSSLSSASIASALNTDKARLQKPITQLQTQQTSDKAEISAWGSIQGSISSLSSVLSGIKDVSSINTLKASSTTNTVATATPASSAVAGTYNLTKVTLAKTQEIYSAVQSSAGKNIGTSTGARLVLQSSAPGSSNGFGFSGSGGLTGLKYASGSAGSFSLAQKAQDASLKINGVPITSTSNTISSAVTGLTIKLATSGSTSLTVAASASTISTAVSAVATNLSAAIATIAKETKYVAPKSSASASASSSKATAGPLLGNFTAANLSTQLLASVSGAAASGLSATAIGLSVSSTGKVSFASATFNTAYAANPTGVSALVSKIYTSLSGVTTGALGSSSATTTAASSANGSATVSSNSGAIAAQTTALQNAIKGLQADALQIAKENNAALEILVQQYTKAESASTDAQITQSYLSIFTGTSNSSSG
jgi:flagellar hook-associated protein 2